MIDFSKISRFSGPRIPDAMMHGMYELKRSGGMYSPKNGGQWVPGGEERVPFRGVVLPVNDKDLVYMDAGSYTQYSRKIYTNGHALEAGGRVYDPQDGITYTVKQELVYGPIHPIKRYLVDSRGEAGEK